MENNNILSIPFKSNSCLKIDLETFIPCTQANFKKVLDTIDMSDIRNSLVNQVYDFLLEKLTACKKCVYMYVNHKNVKAADVAKKIMALKDLLVKRYGLIEEGQAEDRPEKIRLKKSFVYAMEKTGIEVYVGFTFQKAGYTFTVHKNKSGYVSSFYGVACAIHCKSRQAAIDSIDDRIIDFIKNNPERLEYVKKEYETAMIAAGYMDAEEIKAVAAPDMEATTTVKAVDAPTPQVKADNKPMQTAQKAQSSRIKAVVTYIRTAWIYKRVLARQTVKAGACYVSKSAMSLKSAIQHHAECAIGACMKSAIALADDPRRLAIIRAGLAPMNGYASQTAINAGLSPPLKCAIGAGDM